MTASSALADLISKNKNKYQGGNTGKAFKLTEGKTKIRIIQKEPGDKFWFDVGVHWIKASKDGKVIAAVGCRDVVYDMPCEICTAIDLAAKKAMDANEEELIKSWRARKSVLVNALIRSGDKASDTPVVLELTPTTFGNILSVAEEYSGVGTNMFAVVGGMDFVVERRGKGLDTEYAVMAAAASKDVNPDVLTKLHDLKAFVETNYFRGDERKALNAIAQITGVSTAAIGAPSKAATAGMLTSAVAAGASEMDDEFATAMKAAPASPVAAAAPVAASLVTAVAAPAMAASGDAELDELMKEIDAIK